ncbi:MAG: ABC transporter substrate-binding protein [Fusobacteria bacterium]|nr:ABC transporter substrate-binding protein [Fusobacteriota bacterium]
MKKLALFFIVIVCTMTLLATPLRVVAISPTSVGTIQYLGESSSIVGTSQYMTVPGAKVLGNITNPSVTEIAMLNPSYVIVDSYTSQQIVAQLKNLKIPVLMINQSYTLNGAYDSMREIAKIYGKESQINQLINKMNSLMQKNSKKKPISLYFMLSYGRDGDFSINNKTFTSQIMENLGMKNIMDNSPTNQVSRMDILVKDPTAIIVSSGNMGTNSVTLSQLKSTSPYNQLNAVKNNKVYFIDSDTADEPGPNMLQLIEFLIGVKNANM